MGLLGRWKSWGTIEIVVLSWGTLKELAIEIVEVLIVWIGLRSELLLREGRPELLLSELEAVSWNLLNRQLAEDASTLRNLVHSEQLLALVLRVVTEVGRIDGWRQASIGVPWRAGIVIRDLRHFVSGISWRRRSLVGSFFGVRLWCGSSSSGWNVGRGGFWLIGIFFRDVWLCGRGLACGCCRSPSRGRRGLLIGLFLILVWGRSNWGRGRSRCSSDCRRCSTGRCCWRWGWLGFFVWILIGLQCWRWSWGCGFSRRGGCRTACCCRRRRACALSRFLRRGALLNIWVPFSRCGFFGVRIPLGCGCGCDSRGCCGWAFAIIIWVRHQIWRRTVVEGRLIGWRSHRVHDRFVSALGFGALGLCGWKRRPLDLGQGKNWSSNHGIDEIHVRLRFFDLLLRDGISLRDSVVFIR